MPYDLLPQCAALSFPDFWVHGFVENCFRGKEGGGGAKPRRRGTVEGGHVPPCRLSEDQQWLKIRKKITSQRLLDQSQAGVYMGKTPHTPPFWPFWAYSRTLPQGVELLV